MRRRRRRAREKYKRGERTERRELHCVDQGATVVSDQQREALAMLQVSKPVGSASGVVSGQWSHTELDGSEYLGDHPSHDDVVSDIGESAAERDGDSTASRQAMLQAPAVSFQNYTDVFESHCTTGPSSPAPPTDSSRLLTTATSSSLMLRAAPSYSRRSRGQLASRVCSLAAGIRKISTRLYALSRAHLTPHSRRPLVRHKSATRGPSPAGPLRTSRSRPRARHFCGLRKRSLASLTFPARYVLPPMSG